MIRRYFIWGVALLSVMVSFVTAAPVLGENLDPANPPYTVQSLQQFDQNGDGQPDITVMQLKFITSNDRVTVYDRGGDMKTGITWQQTTDFNNDTWVFDIGSDGTAQLIIRFVRNGNKQQALLYNDLNADGQVDYTVQNDAVNVTEAAFPSITAEVQGDWRLPNGRLNWNIAFYTDGNGLKLTNNSDSSVNFTKVWQSFMKLDGIPDAVMQFYDENQDGIPESGIWRLLVDTPDYMGTSRTFIWANVGQTQTPDHPDFIFWPYLVTARVSRYDNNIFRGVNEVFSTNNASNYFDVPPSIEVGWLTGLVSPLQFRGYPIENGFHMNSEVYFKNDRVNYTDFEMEQAYYDLADDHDGNPELHIRHRYFAAGDRYGWALPVDLNEIRWSWNQYNDPGLVFNYKIGLAGRQHIDQQTKVGDFSYYAVPYDQLPQWVMDQKWDLATFVTSENAPYNSSEGIYPWGAIEGVIRGDPSLVSQYFAGQIALDPGLAFQTIPVGLRGEYVDGLGAAPYLYFSPIDRKLHLVGAKACLWNVGPNIEIRCQNLDGGDFINRWQYFENEELHREIIQIDNFVILQDETQVAIKQSSISHEIFRTLPPVDHQGWLALGQKLAQNAISYQPGDFTAMFASIPGTEAQLQNAHFSDFRLIDGGFRFVLHLDPGFKLGSIPSFLDLKDLSPGDYVLQMVNNTFKVMPITPPELVLQMQATQASTDLFTVATVTNIKVSLENHGLQDNNNLTLEVYADPENGTQNDRIWLLLEPIDALSGVTKTREITWSPQEFEKWVIHARITTRNFQDVGAIIQFGEPQDDVVPLASTSTPYVVNTIPPVSSGQFLTLDNEQPFGGIGVIILWVSIGICAVALFALIGMRIRRAHDE